jgi:hypothetical protein
MSGDRNDTDERIKLVAGVEKPVPYVRTAMTERPPVAETARTEAEPLWPILDDRYKAAGTPDNNPMARLVIFLGKQPGKADVTSYRILQYVHLDEGEFGFTATGDQWFSFIFAGKRPKKFKVYGRNIQRTCDYISLHRMPWIRLADRDFQPGDDVPNNEPIFTRFEFIDLKEE